MANQDGKVMLITGASSGIGAETARMAAKMGYRLILVARSADKLHELSNELGTENVLPLSCDITEWDSQRAMFARALEHFGRLDVVFVNAAVMTGSGFLGGEDSPAEWRNMVLTNVYGAAVMARFALPELLKTKGHLIFTGSLAGRVALPNSFYSSTKWAVTGMVESIRQQVTSEGVRVTLVLPGMTDTPIWKGNPPKVPLLQAQDIAATVMFALSQPAHVDVNEVVVRPVGQGR